VNDEKIKEIRRIIYDDDGAGGNIVTTGENQG
jgi:hypothetical protein